jgi:hypothetical protein
MDSLNLEGLHLKAYLLIFLLKVRTADVIFFGKLTICAIINNINIELITPSPIIFIDIVRSIEYAIT